jgi:hypothetical protein
LISDLQSVDLVLYGFIPGLSGTVWIVLVAFIYWVLLMLGHCALRYVLPSVSRRHRGMALLYIGVVNVLPFAWHRLRPHPRVAIDLFKLVAGGLPLPPMPASHRPG